MHNYFDIKLLKFILGWYDDIECYLKEMDEEFDFSNEPEAYNDYLDRVAKYLETGTINLMFNKKQEEFIENYKPLFDALAESLDDGSVYNSIQSLVWKLSLKDIRDFVKTISNNPEYADYIYEALDELEKRGIEEVALGFDSNVNYGISESRLYGKLVDYMDSLQIDEGDYVYNYKTTPDTKYFVQINVKDKNKVTYSQKMRIADILNFNVDKMPTTIEDVNKFVDMIEKKSKLYEDKKEIKELSKICDEYSKTFNKLHRIVCSRGVYTSYELHNTKVGKDSFKDRINAYVDEEMKRIMDDDKQIDTQGVKVRI